MEKRIIALVLVLSLSLLSFGIPGNGVIEVKRKAYTLVIRKDNFAFSLRNPEGKVIGDFHKISGIALGNSKSGLVPAMNFVKILSNTDTLLSCEVSSGEGRSVRVDFRLMPEMINLRVILRGVDSTGCSVEARMAGFGPAYGLGDHGSYGESTNVFGYSNNDFRCRGDKERFVSPFAVFPAQQFAQVLFENGSKRVAINTDEVKLGANDVKDLNIYYFFGDLKRIYSNYAYVRRKEGYPDFRPKFDFFDVGYEAFGSLGWNTAQSTVQKDVEEYLAHGYPLKWVVVGSGFWKGDRKLPTEGSTNSFGIWDDKYQAGRKDNLPNPRYPDVKGFKKYLDDRHLDLFLGIRVNFKSDTTQGGFNNIVNDGPYTGEGLEKGFFVKRRDGQPKMFTAVFPKGNVYLLDGNNSDALDWFIDGVRKWGVMGYKEDSMMRNGREAMDDDSKANKANEALMKNGYYVMVRNSAYSVPGEIIRIEDTEYEQNQDRPLINVLSLAASGATNTYPDIVGGKYHKFPLKEEVKRYFVRNALFAAVCPAMSFGLGPWKLGNPAYEKAIKKAADWHHQFAPYIYSAAVESYTTGYPATMTPLPVAFPADSVTYNLANKARRQYSWMLGASLLATPVYGNDYAKTTSRDVYLPEGNWIDYTTGRKFAGPGILQDYSFPDDKIPVFVGGKGVLVHRETGSEKMIATLYPVKDGNSSFTFYYPDGKSESVITIDRVRWSRGKISITDIESKKKIFATYSKVFKSYSFPIEKGHNYLIKHQNDILK